MNTITRVVVCLLIASLFSNVQAQNKEADSIRKEKVDYKISQLEKGRAEVEDQEKDILKSKISKINKQLDNKEITAEEAENLKKEAAKIAALNIENRVAIIDQKIELLKRNGYDDDQYNTEEQDRIEVSIGSSGVRVNLDSDEKKSKKYDQRTFGENVWAFGFNNTIIEGQALEDSPYKLGGSGFIEWGYTLNTRIFKNNNFWRLKYGLSIQWNKLNIKDNQYLVNTNGAINLEEFPLNVNKVKFRSTNLVFPMHIEFGPSKKIEKDDYFRYSKHNKLKIGLGGYAGVNIGNMQKIKYKVDGEREKDKQRGNYEVSPFIYGLSGYIGIDEVSLYVKYDLNPLFQDQLVNQNNISVGVRFDID
ncbi:MAG: hypothetical protein AB8B52_06205 [Winogradskyella sp.]|uniref:hypothetical protein n=1 Tax=Winogradskyella sp. TaxID=1883156 RepID=UPI00385982E6